MPVFLSFVWILSWVAIGVFAFLAGRHRSRRYLFCAVIAVLVMYASVYFLGRY